MTDEYIRRQDAIDAFNRIKNTLKNPQTAHYDTLMFYEIEDVLEDVEPADVAPIVRCKNCKHHAYDEIFSCYWCEYPGRVRNTTPDGFCEKGEE